MTTPTDPASDGPDRAEAATSQRGGPHGERREAPRSRRHPLTEQCKATSKATGQRCKKLVRGGGVCPQHGGNAPQVRAAREARLLAGEAGLAIGAGDEQLRRDPRAALLSAVHDADAILQRLKGQAATGELAGPLLSAIGEWLDRVSRLSKTVIDARLEEQIVQLEADKAKLVGVAINGALEELGFTHDVRTQFVQAFLRRMRSPSEAATRVGIER